jgi:HEAT repeat protein
VNVRRPHRPNRGGRRRSPSYEAKLIAALRGPLPDRRILAAQILGRIRCRAAIRELEALAKDQADPYLAAAAARALAAIDSELPSVVELARGGPALVRRAVRSAIGGRGKL